MLWTGLIIGYLLGNLFGPLVSAALQRIGWFRGLTTAVAAKIDRLAGYHH